jgi:hypothetical protein
LPPASARCTFARMGRHPPGSIDDAELLRECTQLSAQVRQSHLDAIPLTHANCMKLIADGMDLDYIVDHMEFGAIMYSPRHNEFLFRGQ